MPAHRYLKFAPSRQTVRGATLIEYVLLAALIGLAAFATVRLTGVQLETAYASVSTSVDGAL